MKQIDNEQSECGNNVPPSIMQQRTAEETEVAHDLLQLAYSLPPTQTMPEEKHRPSVMIDQCINMKIPDTLEIWKVIILD